MSVVNFLSAKEYLSVFTYGVKIIKDEKVLHAVGYPTKATPHDLKLLREELATDNELGLTELKDYDIVHVQPDEWKTFIESVLSSD